MDQSLVLVVLVEQEPFVRSQPDGQRPVVSSRGVGSERELGTKDSVDRSQCVGVVGVQAQVDVGEEGAFEELAGGWTCVGGLNGAER